MNYFHYTYARHCGRCIVSRWCRVIDMRVQYIEKRVHTYKQIQHTTTHWKIGTLMSFSIYHQRKKIAASVYNKQLIKAEKFLQL